MPSPPPAVLCHCCHQPLAAEGEEEVLVRVCPTQTHGPRLVHQHCMSAIPYTCRRCFFEGTETIDPHELPAVDWSVQSPGDLTQSGLLPELATTGERLAFEDNGSKKNFNSHGLASSPVLFDATPTSGQTSTPTTTTTPTTITTGDLPPNTQNHLSDTPTSQITYGDLPPDTQNHQPELQKVREPPTFSSHDSAPAHLSSLDVGFHAIASAHSEPLPVGHTSLELVD